MCPNTGLITDLDGEFIDGMKNDITDTPELSKYTYYL